MHKTLTHHNVASRGLQPARLLCGNEASPCQVTPERIARPSLLRRRCIARVEARGSYAARGFTIIELVVSIGILGILMVVAGGVFALTLKSSGQATALIDIHQSLRALEDSLREDLAGVSPNASIMVIQSHAINSYWTEDAKEIDNNANPLDAVLTRDPQREKVVGANVEVEAPRADMLMFFTSRPGTSFRDPEVSGTLQQVVYGHVLPGEWDLNARWAPTLTGSLPPGATDQFDASSFAPNELTYAGPPDYQYDLVPMANNPPVFAIPARDWHLARRGVLIVDQDFATANPPKLPAMGLDDGIAALNVSEDDPEYSALKKEFYLRDGRRDFVIDQTGFDFKNDVVKINPNPAMDSDPMNATALVNWMPRSRLDYSPPSNQIDRMGQYFLPHCASFKVEWALDMEDVITHFGSDASFVKECADIKDLLAPLTQEVIWVDPLNFAETVEKLRSALDQMTASTANYICSGNEMPEVYDLVLGKLIFPDPTNFTKPNPDRFVDNSGGNIVPYDTHIFYPTKPLSVNTAPPFITGDPDPLFPKALRITVDVYDPAGRLERPIRHVMILPVGE